MKKPIFYCNPLKNEYTDLGIYKKIKNGILKTTTHDITLSMGEWKDVLEEKYDYCGLYGKTIEIDGKNVIITPMSNDDFNEKK